MPAAEATDRPERWILTRAERALVLTKATANRLDFALLLLFFRDHGRFPRRAAEVDPAAVAVVAHQLATDAPAVHSLSLSGRTAERHRAEIRAHHGFREATVADAEELESWLREQIAIIGGDPAGLDAQLEARCRALRIEPPTAERAERIVRAAIRAYDDRFYANIRDRLAPDTRTRLEALLRPAEDADTSVGGGADRRSTPEPAVLLRLRSGPGRPSLAGIQEELAKLELIRAIALPCDLFDRVRPQDLERYRRRVAAEAPYELRRHPEPARLAWLAAFVHLRGRTLVDDLVDLLIETVHHIGARAERRVERELLGELRRVSGKPNLLFDLAGAALARPDGTVREVVFPVVGEQTLQDLVKERNATGPGYRTTLRTVIRNSYKGHYRRMLPQLLGTLEFRSNNAHHRPIIQALDLLKRYADSTRPLFPAEEAVPIDGIVRGLWRDAVLEADTEGRERVNRITYEICVLDALRHRLRCKEIWVVGANRYRNPDEDLPADFEMQRTAYYQALALPREAERFVTALQEEMRAALATLDAGMPGNGGIRITNRRGGSISVSPFTPQPEPPNLVALKTAVTGTWPMTSLLDMLKETDLRLGFTTALTSPTAYETLERAVLQPRLLLCLHGLGTNAGVQRMVGAQSGMTAKDLAYVRRRYVTADGLRRAIAIVTNGTLHARNPAIWGEGTTACAADSKHFGAWDQNLTTQWHVRYGGRGVMIYWHVERKSLCIHSQLKSPSSSEVASMIEGVVRHCTEMEVERQYVDSHGQSTVAFAFCRLLGFHLMPRLKAIGRQKLSRPEAGRSDAYPTLQRVLGKPIDWEVIRQNYDQMVKYVTAVRLGTAETEAILRRFTRNNIQHPTYKAFAELGKAVKTIFLCRYLHREDLRREINEGLNVIEHWNSANDFIFFARHGEFASNRREDHEISMLALHLLQNCMVYINTLMLQQTITQPHWAGRLGTRDLGALTPLFWQHVNPYGRFDLDMTARLPLD